MNNRRVKISFGLSRKNLFAIMLLIASGWILLLSGLAQKRAAFQNNPPARANRVQSARQLVDPNKDSPGSLVRLDGIGRNRANNIIDYRNANSTATRPAFEKLSDMENVKGLGPLTVTRFENKTILEQK